MQYQQHIYQSFAEGRKIGQKKIAVLIDPDKTDAQQVAHLAKLAARARADYFFVGGSLVVQPTTEQWVQQLKQNTSIPVILFPGSLQQVTPAADAVFLLSLISGRNADMLIGQHVVAAPLLRQMPLEIIPTGYMLIDGGAPTTVSYISNSSPIPADKPTIAVCTAMAGEMLGLRVIYLDAGSGARTPVSSTMIQAVSQHINVPLIVGGGIKTPEQAAISCRAGADIVVIGNILEKSPDLLKDLVDAVHEQSSMIPTTAPTLPNIK